MRMTQWLGMGLVSLIMGINTASAQFGAPAAGAGGAAAPAAAAPAAAAPAAAGAQPGFIAKACATLDECRRKCCKTPMGQMLNAMTTPAATFTGGVIPSFCPIMPSLADLAQPGVTGAAEQAKKDELESKARRAAVRYLGTLDCRYYPEAEAALIAALRSDRIECVRLEAAIAFANGCCCTRKVMDALEICVSGSDRDGNPSEHSCRVRDFAEIALERCVACYRDVKTIEYQQEEKKDPKEPKELPPAEKLEKPPKPNLTKADLELIERARKTVAQYQARRESRVVQPVVLQKGQRSLYDIIRYGTDGAPQSQQPQALPVSRPSGPANPPRDVPVAKTVAPKDDKRLPEPVAPSLMPPAAALVEAQPVVLDPNRLNPMPVQPVDVPGAPAMLDPNRVSATPVQPVAVPNASATPDPNRASAPPMQPVATTNAPATPAPAMLDPNRVSATPIEPVVVPSAPATRAPGNDPMGVEKAVFPAIKAPEPSPMTAPVSQIVAPKDDKVVKEHAASLMPPLVASPADSQPKTWEQERAGEAMPLHPVAAASGAVTQVSAVISKGETPQSAGVSAPDHQVATASPLRAAAVPAQIAQPIAAEDNVAKTINELLTSTAPEKRLHAVTMMGSFEWQRSPKIVSALVKAARFDTDRDVRVNAIRQFAAMRIDVPHVVFHLKFLEQDEDGLIAREATLAMQSLQPSK